MQPSLRTASRLPTSTTVVLPVRDLESGRYPRSAHPRRSVSHERNGALLYTGVRTANGLPLAGDPVLHRSEVLLLAADGSERVNSDRKRLLRRYAEMDWRWRPHPVFQQPRRASQLCHQRLKPSGMRTCSS